METGMAYDDDHTPPFKVFHAAVSTDSADRDVDRRKTNMIK